VDERILGDEGMPPTGETYCSKDTVNGQIQLVCKVTNRYRNGQLKEKGQRIIVKDKATKEGKWEYYTETGTLDKTINYINDKPVQ
jgi:antitoxin component YwqK of YwqJK toxin-antitoxin module